MSLFRRKKKQSEAVAYNVVRNRETVLFRKQFVQSSSFRGFRRIKLSASHVDNYDQTLSYFRERDFDFKGSEILLECIKIESGSDVFYRINVYVDGRMIGRVSEASDESISMLTDYEYDKAHVKVEEFYHKDGTVMGSNVYLFVHYPGVAPVKISVE